jgi:Pilus formation protein N terminal region
MSSHRFILKGAAVMTTLLAFGAAAMAADILERPPRILELQPGITKIWKADRQVQVIAIGNPNIANASAINLNAIAITGKGVGLTNFILFDAEGKEISDTIIQVVGADAYRHGDNVKERHEVRVYSMWGGPSAEKAPPTDRRYLCAQNCSTVQLDKPIELNPPGNTSAAVGTTTSNTFVTVPAPQGPTPQGGGSPPGPNYAQ